MDTLLHNIISKYSDNKCLWDTYCIDYRKITKELQLWIVTIGYDSRRIEFKWFVILKYLQYNIEYKIEYYIEYKLYYNIYFK